MDPSHPEAYERLTKSGRVGSLWNSRIRDLYVLNGEKKEPQREKK